jgi:tetratricopeptide (TPR) repeat protein
MSVEMLEDVIGTYRLNVDTSGSFKNQKYMENQIFLLEIQLDPSRGTPRDKIKTTKTEAIEWRLSVASSNYKDGNNEDAAYQISRARKIARHVDQGLTAELAVIAAIEFVNLAEVNLDNRYRLLREACLNFMFAAEAYIELGKKDQAKQYFGYFLENVLEIKYTSSDIAFINALETMTNQFPEEIKDYYFMSLEQLENVVKTYGFKVSLTSDPKKRKDFEMNAKRSESQLKSLRRGDPEEYKAMGKTVIEFRLSAALSYFSAGRNESAAIQISKARRTAMYLDTELTAELAVIAATEFVNIQSDDSLHKKEVLGEACLSYIFVVEAYCKLKKIDQARQYFNDFLDNAKKIKFTNERRWVTVALKTIGQHLPDEMKSYYRMARSWYRSEQASKQS